MSGDGDDEAHRLVEVCVLGFPLGVHLRAQEHTDALLRELTLIAQSRRAARLAPAAEHEPPDLPERFVALVDELTHQYEGVAGDVERARDAAVERGDERVDLVYRVPPQVAQACRRLDQVFEAADEYCRQGEHLLTLAAPPDVAAFRRWFLGEFVRQLEGEPPRPWAPTEDLAPDPAEDLAGNSAAPR